MLCCEGSQNRTGKGSKRAEHGANFVLRVAFTCVVPSCACALCVLVRADVRGRLDGLEALVGEGGSWARVGVARVTLSGEGGISRQQL